MSWRDRDYNQSGGAEGYLSNPSSILGLSLPFGRWFGVTVRLNFWLLFVIAIELLGMARGASPLMVILSIALLLVALLLHDFGHRIFASWVGGRLDEFVLWPAGGMIFPTVPPGPWPLFVGHIGGMAVNLALAAASMVGVGLLTGSPMRFSLNPLNILGGPGGGAAYGSFAVTVLAMFATINVGIFMANLLPYYWFDGGFLLQSFLWPFFGSFKAINITCWVGMILAAPMVVVSLSGANLMGVLFWALLFFSAYSRRKQLQSEGTNEFDAAIAFSAQDSGRDAATDSPRRRRWMRPGFAQAAAKRAAKERADQTKIDGILAKVSAEGMQSLSWSEKRALRQATERQRRAETGQR